MPTLESSEWLELWRAVVHALGSGRSLFVFPFGSLFGVQADLKVRLYGSPRRRPPSPGFGGAGTNRFMTAVNQ